MTDRPILFSAPMVRALLEGRKTQTRRVVSAGNWTVNGHRYQGASPAWKGLDFSRAVVRTKSAATGFPDLQLATPFRHPSDPAHPDFEAVYNVRPVYEVGDRLWVRETFNYVGSMDPGYPLCRATWREDANAEGFENIPADEPKGWTPAIHMPRSASRLTLTVTDMRLQRLKEIANADARAEGAELPPNHTSYRAPYTLTFASIWEAINGAGSWDANPWVAAISFTVRRGNIDRTAP